MLIGAARPGAVTADPVILVPSRQQVAARCVPPWTVLDAGELQLKLQRRLPRPDLADYQRHVTSRAVDKPPGHPPSDLAVTAALVMRHCF
jgi:hypothetical protein